MNLEELRNQIDQVDQDIIQLLEKRMTIVQKISEVKEAQGHNILDSTRELKVLNRAQQAIKTPAYQETILQTYQDIMKNSREYQSKARLK